MRTSPAQNTLSTEEMSCFLASSIPSLISPLTPVGEVHHPVTLFLSIISHHMSFLGWSGVPSYSMEVQPLMRGP